MPADDGWTTVTAARPVSAASASRSGRPQLTLVDIILMLWRAKWIVLLVALPIFVDVLCTDLVETYRQHPVFRQPVKSASLIRLSGCDRQRSRQEKSRNLVELSHSPVIADRVIQKLGLEVIYPKMAMPTITRQQPTNPDREQAVQVVQKNFYAGAAPKTLLSAPVSMARLLQLMC